MSLHTEKAAPGAGNTESGKEQNINLSVSLSGKNVKCAELYGTFSLDYEGAALFEEMPVAEIIGNMLYRLGIKDGYGHLTIEVWRDEDA